MSIVDSGVTELELGINIDVENVWLLGRTSADDSTDKRLELAFGLAVEFKRVWLLCESVGPEKKKLVLVLEGDDPRFVDAGADELFVTSDGELLVEKLLGNDAACDEEINTIVDDVGG